MTPSPSSRVICVACGSSNRPSAMFCIGCARRLPTFVASGPSALDSVRSLPPRSSARAQSNPPSPALPAETPWFWLRLVLLVLAMMIVFMGWYVSFTRTGAGPAVAGTEATTWASGQPRGQAGGRAVALRRACARALLACRQLPWRTLRAMLHLKPHAPGAVTRLSKRLQSSIAPSPPPTAQLLLRSSFRRSEGAGHFGQTEISTFYGSLREPLAVRSIRTIDKNRVEVRYRYRADQHPVRRHRHRRNRIRPSADADSEHSRQLLTPCHHRGCDHHVFIGLTGFVRRHPVLLAVATALVILVLLFDWNWLRPPLERYISQKTQREFKISDLHVDLGFVPTIRMRDVYFSNADWSQHEAMAKIEMLEFSVSLRDLPEKILIPRVALTKPDLVFERLPDDRKNWILAEPSERRRASCESARCRSITGTCAIWTTGSLSSSTCKEAPSTPPPRRRSRMQTRRPPTFATPPSTSSVANTTTLRSPVPPSPAKCSAFRSPASRSR